MGPFLYLSRGRQRVRVNGELSAWARLFGVMPQASWLEPLTYLVLINDLMIDCRVHKFVDDTTLTETLFTRSHTSTSRSAIADKPRCSVGNLWQK